ncbi:MAG: hypothetical protein LRZ85_02170 [Alphaproteobacteria bacterium]|nr:hypothetical protein [Alphaproteobacteria bacterium]MCD8519833.1 hypothetical protein [Alphaproteobacteria bacterium]MCD8526490.1 hypothetical protein [Alphaproteobacteria bacterium]MCD8570370.1 hypothetical protein [Alphaproteobacteria bacterium]
MPTHAELAAKLLVDAATFFRTLGEQNEQLRDQMMENAGIFDQMAGLLTQDPGGEMNDTSYGELAGKLLKDAANFFRSLAQNNEPIREQMNENADVYTQIADLVTQNPVGILD